MANKDSSSNAQHVEFPHLLRRSPSPVELIELIRQPLVRLPPEHVNKQCAKET